MYKLIVLAVVLTAAYASPINQVLLSNGQYTPVTYTSGVIPQNNLVYTTGQQQVLGVQQSPLVYTTAGQQLVGQQYVGQQYVGQQVAGQQLVGQTLVGQQQYVVPSVYSTGAKVQTSYSPVEQHGYKIVY